MCSSCWQARFGCGRRRGSQSCGCEQDSAHGPICRLAPHGLQVWYQRSTISHPHWGRLPPTTSPLLPPLYHRTQSGFASRPDPAQRPGPHMAAAQTLPADPQATRTTSAPRLPCASRPRGGECAGVPGVLDTAVGPRAAAASQAAAVSHRRPAKGAPQAGQATPCGVRVRAARLHQPLLRCWRGRGADRPRNAGPHARR